MKKNYFLALTVLAAAIFAFLWYQEKKNNKRMPVFSVESFSSLDSSQKALIREISMTDYLESWKKTYRAPLTEPLDPKDAATWVTAYKKSLFFF